MGGRKRGVLGGKLRLRCALSCRIRGKRRNIRVVGNHGRFWPPYFRYNGGLASRPHRTRVSRFTEQLLETYITYKREKEVDAVRLRPHPFEFALYYDI